MATLYPSVSFFGKESFTPLHFSEELFEFNWEINPGHKVLEHVHPRVDETIEVTSGEVTFVIEGVEKRIGKGGSVVIQRGVPHEIRNASKEKASCRVSYSPAGDQGKFFEVGIFLLNEAPESNGSMGHVSKMMYLSRQMGYEDFSTPATAMGKLTFGVVWTAVKLWGDLAGWKRITKRFSDAVVKLQPTGR
jgi:quercetin dioxygenase-like cupin family protein